MGLVKHNIRFREGMSEREALMEVILACKKFFDGGSTEGGSEIYNRARRLVEAAASSQDYWGNVTAVFVMLKEECHL